MRYSILGTVRAVCGATELELGPPKRLALLALLLLRAPGPLTLNEAVDILWDNDPPASAVNVVHRHIGALRRILEPGLRSRTKAEHLVRAADGYRLLVDTSTCDLLRFRGLRAQAQLAVKEGDAAQGAQDFIEALRLWRGPVVAAGTHVAQHPLFTSVGHEYVATVKEAADVILTAAPTLTEEILPALRGAAECHPFDEAIHSRIVASLAATGRQAEALKQFETIRNTLAEELGIEPGPGLRAAQQYLLRRKVTREPDKPVPRAKGAIRPEQLPADCVPFAGRLKAVSQCLELLPLEGESHPSTMIAAVCGMAGIGKTTFAVHWAHMVADRFPDGQIYADLQGYHASQRPLDASQAMCDVLDALGVSQSRTHTSAAALGSLYRSALAGRRLLIVLDNARDCEHVRPLLPSAPGCVVIVTSRRRLEGLAITNNARIITLQPMTHQEGLELLDRRLGANRIKADPASAEEIVDLCGGLPLTLAVAGTRALINPELPLATLLTHLRDSQDSLDAFSGHDARTDVRRVFACSYQALSSGAAALLRLLSLHPSRDITVPAAASLAGADLRTTREHMAELADHHILVEEIPGRYTCHELLRAHAAELSDALDDDDVRSEARARIFEYYLHSVDAATALIAAQRSTVILPPPRPGVRPQQFRGCADATEWISAERHILPALVRNVSQFPRAEAFHRQFTSALEMPLD
ncbi:BTAD domain-containing putative transcriptional regulator [Streptomyces sp. ISID311]|uniref:AfsR/SARP family transcriptional regulator n=1 Tax=Streptomyces sp. ISID311 TaxID=2601673 RepID=UPI0011BD4350|nr:BTAD domain-containing putative transcriptional regulator [Streptomyces sp. ISID311]TXC99849.1 AfsR/SARP family transcriptional regulator [Streptomyces sp. ISID311]